MSRWRKQLLDKVDYRSIIMSAEGVNGLVAVTSDYVYIVRGGALERNIIKSFEISSITSIDIGKPGVLTNGHFQIIGDGSIDQNRLRSALSYATSDNAIMIRKDYEDFLKIEKKIYELKANIQNNRNQSVSAIGRDIDPLDQIEKLADLRSKGIITEQEFEKKKTELLAKL